MAWTETARRQYLDALGVDIWVRRDTAAPEPEVVVPAATPKEALQPVVVVPVATGPASAGGAIATMDWPALEAEVRSCTRCRLHGTRTQTVFGVGNRSASWLFVGEAPGADEDRQGEPFVGRAGQLLNAMLFALGLKREDVYIANVLKCRPPENRDPQDDEAGACEPFLVRQIELIGPRIIVALGRHAAHSLLKTEQPLGRMRGQKLSYHGTPLIVTYHPAYLLRSPLEKRKAWDDLCLARKLSEAGEAVS